MTHITGIVSTSHEQDLTRGNKNNPSRQCTLIFGFWEIMSDDLNWEINTAEISPMNSPRHSW